MRALLALLAGVSAAYVGWRSRPRKLKPIFIDMARVNREARDQAMPDPEEIVYIERVKERIMLGDKCTHPPLYNPRPKARLSVVSHRIPA